MSEMCIIIIVIIIIIILSRVFTQTYYSQIRVVDIFITIKANRHKWFSLLVLKAKGHR